MPLSIAQTSRRPVRAAVVTKAAVRSADALGLSGAALAKVLGVSTATVSRMRRGDHHLAEQDKAFELALQLVRLYRGLEAMTGGDPAAVRAWLDTFNPDLDAIPREAIATVTGLVGAAAYIDAFRSRV